MRYSHQRELIENNVKCRCDHPTADMVYASVRKIEPNISLGTVYRNLKSLSDEHKIYTLETVDKKIHYDGDTSLHSHFICLNCGRIIDIKNKISRNSELDEMGFEVVSEKSILYGYCDKCKKIH